MNSVLPPSPAAVAPVGLLERALDVLDATVSFLPEVVASSHTVVFADGFDNPDIPTVLGRYLVGALAGAVDCDARLCEALLAHGIDRRAEITRTVTNIIGSTNDFSTPPQDERFRDTRRNAWIGEGVGHALLMLAARHDSSFIGGRVRALSEIHAAPTRQGLDSVSLYSHSGVLAVAIGESKATRSRASEELTKAAEIFADIDNGAYGPDLRSRLAMFRGFLPDDLAVQVSDRLWSDNSCYLPMIVHQDPFTATARRSKLDQLRPPVERRRVIIAQLTEFHVFFDSVADAMRAAVPEVVAA